ncbi:MAG: DUF2586 family protein [Flammeovirgaceae bacterium]
MALPNVEITQLNGQLGTLPPNEDGIAGLIVLTKANDTAFTNANITKATAILLRSVEDALPDAEDPTSIDINSLSPHAFLHISDFYNQAPINAELYVTFIQGAESTNDDPTNGDDTKVNSISEALSFVDLASSPPSTIDYAAQFIDQTQGQVKLIGVVSELTGSDTDIAKTTDNQLITAIDTAATIVSTQQAQHARYVSFLIEGITSETNAATLTANLPDLRTRIANRVSVVIGAEPAKFRQVSILSSPPASPPITESVAHSALGLVLGKLAASPVQRNLGRVKDGAIISTGGGLSNGQSYTSYRNSFYNTLDDYHYIFFRKHLDLNGFYLNNDHTAVQDTDDYAHISSGRTIDKASRIAKRVYTHELLDEIDLNDDGTMRPSVIAYFQATLQNSIAAEMFNEISNVIVFADPTQNVAQTNEIKVTMNITRKGYAEQIAVTIGFTAPGA